jgi:GNAT superfamily N-acetyltransferase
MTMNLIIRPASLADVPVLRALIDVSVRGLQKQDYSPSQLEGGLERVYGVDSQLIADKTYFVAVATPAPSDLDESSTERSESLLVGCGGWSKRRTLYGGDQYAGREDALLDPQQDAAKIRAFFVHPDWARRGIGSMILEACEAAAASDGFIRFEMGATLTGVPFYRAKGYVALEELSIPLADGESLAIVRMEKRVPAESQAVPPQSVL